MPSPGEPLTTLLIALLAAGVGAVTTYVACRARAERLRGELDAARIDLTRLRAEAAAFDTRIADVRESQQRLVDTFGALSGEALRRNNEAFLQLARTELEQARTAGQADLEKRERAISELVAPIRDGLSRYDQKLAEIERDRTTSFGALAQRLDLVVGASEQLRGETQKLSQALRAPAVRGRWGEIQLQRVAELAGMIEHCDFTVQDTVQSENGRQRPDMTVRLPNGRTIVVDAKAPLSAYLESLEVDGDEARRERLVHHARQIRAHVDALSRKSYWEQFRDASPEFVVLFIPGEVFFSAALEHDPSLIESAVDQRVIIATPTTLIALLKAVAYGWRQERLTRDALQIGALARELCERLETVARHFSEVGASLGKAVSAYNRSVRSLESRVLVTARRLQAHGIGEDGGMEVALVEQGVEGEERVPTAEAVALQ